MEHLHEMSDGIKINEKALKCNKYDKEVNRRITSDSHIKTTLEWRG